MRSSLDDYPLSKSRSMQFDSVSRDDLIGAREKETVTNAAIRSIEKAGDLAAEVAKKDPAKAHEIVKEAKLAAKNSAKEVLGLWFILIGKSTNVFND